MTKSREEILNERENYYNQTFVKFEIIKCLKNRELCFLSHKGENPKRAVRYLVAFNLDYLNKHFQWAKMNRSLINLYHSVAKLKDIPIFSYHLKTRTKEKDYIEFNNNYENYCIGYNLFIDMDGKSDFEKCHNEAKELKKIFDEYKLPYYILNSSFKGFHFVIPANYMPETPIRELVETIFNVLYNIKGIYDFSSLDNSITDIKRVCKVPYSFVGDGSIVLPLTDNQFENFTPELVTPDNVLKKIKIKNRGLLTRKWDLTTDILKENVKKFINDFK